MGGLRRRAGGGDDHDGAADADRLADIRAFVGVGAGVLVLDDLDARVNVDGFGAAAVAVLVVFDLEVGDAGAVGATEYEGGKRERAKDRSVQACFLVTAGSSALRCRSGGRSCRCRPLPRACRS